MGAMTRNKLGYADLSRQYKDFRQNLDGLLGALAQPSVTNSGPLAGLVLPTSAGPLELRGDSETDKIPKGLNYLVPSAPTSKPKTKADWAAPYNDLYSRFSSEKAALDAWLAQIIANSPVANRPENRGAPLSQGAFAQQLPAWSGGFNQAALGLTAPGVAQAYVPAGLAVPQVPAWAGQAAAWLSSVTGKTA